jgi:hypothetical protein
MRSSRLTESSTTSILRGVAIHGPSSISTTPQI